MTEIVLFVVVWHSSLSGADFGALPVAWLVRVFDALVDALPPGPSCAPWLVSVRFGWYNEKGLLNDTSPSENALWTRVVGARTTLKAGPRLARRFPP